MRRAIILKHVPHEGPGRILPALERAGFGCETRELFRGDPVPEALSGFDALVVMGGPMGVEDLDDARFPFLAAEVRLLERAVASDFPTLGVCLGSQLLAHAAGARVYPATLGEPPVRVREVGWGAVHFVESPAREPVLAGLNSAETVLHWHGDTFDLPRGAVLLASTLVCKHQMFRLGSRQFALQFHPEVESGDVEGWLEADADYVLGALGPNGRARISADTERCMPELRERGARLLSNIVSFWT
ncbi:MAG TPA: gamma-glutamyl-gamma-aminobutyrate hydrolase family protein [Polyangiaceae bacterium]